MKNFVKQLLEAGHQPGPPKNLKRFFATLTDNANNVAAGYDAGLELMSVDGDVARVRYVDHEDEDGGLDGTITFLENSRQHNCALVKVSIDTDDPDVTPGSGTVVSASGINVFRCFYV